MTYNWEDMELETLKKRSIELNCLYQVHEILLDLEKPLEILCPEIIKIIPPAMQYPDLNVVKIKIGNKIFQSPDFTETQWHIRSDITSYKVVIGYISVYYKQKTTSVDKDQFLAEEKQLIQTIANSLSQFIVHQNDMETVKTIVENEKQDTKRERDKADVILDMLEQTNQDLYFRISRKMLYELSQGGNIEARNLLQSVPSFSQSTIPQETDDDIIINQEHSLNYLSSYSKFVYDIARKYYSEEEILEYINNWVQEDKLGTLSHIVNRHLPLADVDDAMRRYFKMAPSDMEASLPSNWGIKISLIRRFLSNQPEYIEIAKELLEIKDFLHLLENVVYCDKSRGRLGGKSARILLINKIINNKSKSENLLKDIKFPKTWFVTSDVIIHYMHYNNFDDIFEQKYKQSNQIKLEYPYIIHLFKKGHFPEDISKMLVTVLDDFQDSPLIVRSSSLLDDRTGISFSGKYRSIILSNQGSKQERLKALMDAIAEVYASTFAPEPIEYRVSRGLLDYDEEMGVIIQEVVGTRSDKYFFPIFSGIAYTEDNKESGLDSNNNVIKMTFGFGTRIVNHADNESPIQIIFNGSNIISLTPDTELNGNFPKTADVINLKLKCIETVDIKVLLKKIGTTLPKIENIVSVYKDNNISQVTENDLDLDNMIITFRGLLTKTPFLSTISTILNNLEATLKTPVSIEFASDGHKIFLLQCRCHSTKK
ncbi:MAG: PEP/pyruvate-binding domain-containing protein [bacterium]